MTTQVRRRGRAIPAVLAVSLGATALGACGGGHQLAEYDFANHSLAVVSDVPPRPEFHTGAYDFSERESPLATVLDAGARVAKEVEVRRARARLDSAATFVDIGERMGGRTAERAARYLAATPAMDPRASDFLLEVYVREFGINATDWNAAATLFVNAEAVLIDNRTGNEVWASDVRAWETLTPRVWDAGPVPRDAITTTALMTVSVADFQGVLEHLADLSADAVTNRLRDDLRDVRRKR